MKSPSISIIGIGKLGLCLGLNLERTGFKVVGMDLRHDYIKSLSEKTFFSTEPSVNELLRESKKLEFTTSLSAAVKADVIFVCVDTPSTSEFRYDHSKIESILTQIEKLGRSEQRKELVINCTTFPGYCQSISDRLQDLNYFISYNPEFIAQGSIIKDQAFSELVLIGEADQEAGDKLEMIYRMMCLSSPKVKRMGRTEAELTKLAVNCFLTTKISYANMIGDIATKLGCDSSVILDAVGSDSRIGSKYLKPGFGFGGPCFPRDNRALARCADDVGIDAVISKATDESNEKHLEYQIEDFVSKNPDTSKIVEIDFVTYKKESTIIEESQQLKFAQRLKDLGYKITIRDRRQEVLDQIKDLL